MTCFWGAVSPLAAVHAGSSLALRQSHQVNKLIASSVGSSLAALSMYVVSRAIAAAAAGKTESVGERIGLPGRPTNVTNGTFRFRM